MELLTRTTVFYFCICVCSSQMTQLAFQRALQARLNAMRTLMMQNMAQNDMNALSGSQGPSSNADMLRQLNTFMGVQNVQGSDGTQSNFNRQSRNLPTVVTLNGPDSSSGNSQNDNKIDSNQIQTGSSDNLIPGNGNQVVVVNKNPEFTNNENSRVFEENTSPNVDVGGSSSVVIESSGFQTGSGILLPDSSVQTNTTFSRSFSTPFSFPSSSASFWMGSSTGGSASASPTQPSVSESNNSPNSASTEFVSIFSGSPGMPFSSSSSSNLPPFVSSAWNRFMTGSRSFEPTNPTSGTDKSGSTDVTPTGNIVTSPMSGGTAIEMSEGFISSQPTSFTNTASGPAGFNEAGTTLSGGSITTQEPALKCTEEFKELAGHTLCMTDDVAVTNSGITPADKQMITEYHNNLRSGVMPPAEDLVELKWDERLAAVAAKWAKQCTLGHDKERTIPEIGMSVGQNVAVGYRTWQSAIQTWYDEINDYRYGFEPDSYLGPEGWKTIAHFTQIVHNTTQLIGCGYAECPNTEYVRYYVCNYASAQSELAFPYTAGSRCGRCMKNCNSGLCDCGDLVCLNKGVLDPGSCTCQCPKSYKGRSCEILDCPAKDNWICGRDWPHSFCDMYSNVKEECPYMCGVCAGGKNPLVPATNKTFTSDFGCTYSGVRGTPGECLEYGNKGADMLMCQSEGGRVGCGECEKYFNIKRDYCPVMCGLCDPPCKGMRCSNGGTLDTATCKCTCRPPFTGDTCEYAQCPVNGDPTFCRFWPKRYCRQYYNVPEDCPFMCGICKKDSPENTGNTSLNTNGGGQSKR